MSDEKEERETPPDDEEPQEGAASEPEPAEPPADAEQGPERDASLDDEETPADLPPQEGWRDVSLDDEETPATVDGHAPGAEADTLEAPAEQSPAEEPEEEETPPLKAKAAREKSYDGLDAGLSWFGGEPFEPPVPTGYALALPGGGAIPAASAAAAPAGTTAEAMRQRIRQRIDARRKEAVSQKRWYQRIPIGAISMVPIAVVLAVLVIFYPPWAGMPSAKEALDPALLTAPTVASQKDALKAMGVVEAVPNCWQVLAGNVLRMDAERASATLGFALPAGLTKYEVGCDVCVVSHGPEWSLWLTLGPNTGIGMKTHPQKPGRDYVGGRRQKAGEVAMLGYEYTVKPSHWYSLRIVVDGGATYLFNGKTLGDNGASAAASGKAEITIFNSRVLVRNWSVKPLD